MGGTVYHIPKKTAATGIGERLAQCTTSVINDWLEVSSLAAHPDAAGA